MPPNRAFSSATTFTLWEGLDSVLCRGSHRCIPRGKVMGTRYPDQVGGHNLVCSFLFLWYLVPVWDHFATTVAVGVFGRHGATQLLALGGSWWEWPGGCHNKWRVSSKCFGPPERECEATYSIVWVKCATSTECN